MNPLELLGWLAFASVVVMATATGFVLGLAITGIFRLAVQVSERQEQRRLAEAERRLESDMPQARLIAALSALNRLPRDPAWQRRFLAGLQAQWWPTVPPLVPVDPPEKTMDPIQVRQIQQAVRTGLLRLKH